MVYILVLAEVGVIKANQLKHQEEWLLTFQVVVVWISYQGLSQHDLWAYYEHQIPQILPISTLKHLG